MISRMRIKSAKTLGVAAVVGAALFTHATTRAETITTLSGETYDVTKLLNKEDDGITVKHTKGIAKIPFYELDEATRTRYGHTGKLGSPIRHQPAPDTALLPELPESPESDDKDGAAGVTDDIELNLDPAMGENTGEEDVSVTDSGAGAETRTPKAATTRAKASRQVVVRKVIEVKASALGSAKKAGDPNYGPVTTDYTPYGNYSYAGLPGGYPDAGFGHVLSDRHLYFIPPPPCNRRLFEWRDLRRWQGNGGRVSRFSFAHYPN